MPDLELRWSSLESRKPHARPFGVLFREPGRPPRGLTLTGPELLFYGAFRTAALEMLGELVDDPAAEAAGDPQRAWLDRLAELLPPATVVAIVPVDHQDPMYGMQYRFEVRLAGPGAGGEPALADAGTLLDYQLLQATVAHQTGALVRLGEIEAIGEAGARRAAWIALVRTLLSPVGDG
ncbi:MAG TPA: hypothetical protein VFO60_06945 [Candidatus Dormibacteraeota bacterium]|nr:hypothetical protein [Candidatus Dormibacteraeota bacterium]